MNRNVRMIALSIGVLSGLYCIQSSLAYLTSYQEIENHMQAGTETTQIIEEFPPPDLIPLTEDPQYPKTVMITNPTGENNAQTPCYVRAALSFSDYDIAKGISFTELNTSDWRYHDDDGFYYYQKILYPGETTPPLFSGIRIQGNLVETQYQSLIDDFHIGIYEESVQLIDGKTMEETWDYFDSEQYSEGETK